jgi:hypothetical protein
MLELLVFVIFIAVPLWFGVMLFDAAVELVRWTKLRNQYRVPQTTSK